LIINQHKETAAIKTITQILGERKPSRTRANTFRFLQKKAIAPYPGEGKDKEIATKSIEEMEKSLWGVHGQRRQPGNLRHKLADILAIAFAALLCGLKDYEDRENLGREKEGWFRTFLELPKATLIYSIENAPTTLA
jgi:hypothetical protein